MAPIPKIQEIEEKLRERHRARLAGEAEKAEDIEMGLFLDGVVVQDIADGGVAWADADGFRSGTLTEKDLVL